ncbi:uncharacterized protein [Epargyreus clarus]|uniref:uncharacterized protein n=1 Tax=Epargyreus clarus TaxID=520877 RepID=UPI003C2B39EC
MEEELNENELEERLYSMLHYQDDTQVNLNVNQKDVENIIQSAPRNTVRRYWRIEEEPSPYQKVNTPKETPTIKNVTEKTDSKSKDEKRGVASPPPANLLSMFQSPVPQNLKRTIEIIENDEPNGQVVELDWSSDDDEVIEVALPPKPTITIESSDEDEVCAISKEATGTVKDTTPGKKSPNEREVAASPVPSVVSSVSDDFIRGDCIALNISSRHPNNESFDFSLHGSDLLVQTPSKKKKRKKNKDCNTSTPIASPACDVPVTDKQVCFATPKSKAKNKKQKNKSYLVSEKSIPNPDVYDSDSNQSSELNKNPTCTVANKSNLSSDVNESDSNQPDIQNNANISKQAKTHTDVPETVAIDNQDVAPKATKRNDSVIDISNIVDLTGTSEQNTSVFSIDENIVMGNVSGLTELPSEPDYPEEVILQGNDAPKLGSTNVPAILYADLDFNNLNGKERPSKKRRYSVTTLRAEMEKFYNESWGGENFNHREIQKYMSRDKSLWVIDPKDRMSALSKRKVTCNYCNRPGHRDDTCRLKPPVCYMCGSIGHNEPRCPRKICVNCGSPNHMYSSMCRNCYNWHGITCAECGQGGHPSSHCPDLWRRYHNTITENMPLEENHQSKKHHQMFCSGCTRRGHLVHSCRITVPFSGLPINSPYVSFYNPVYPPTINANETTGPTNQPNPNLKNNQQDDTITSGSTPHRTDRNKRQSKSPVVHETHLNKKRNLSTTDTTDIRVNTKSPVNSGQKRKTSQSKDVVEDVEGANKNGNKADPKTVTEVEKAPDLIPIFSGNRDKQGQMIQDNEVSDTSDVVTSARIYISSDIMDKLSKTDGPQWLNETAEKNNVTIQKTDSNLFLIIKGTVGDQEAFQTELRNWINTKVSGELPKLDNIDEATLGNDQAFSNNIPKKRHNVLRIINKALESLKEDLGDPQALFKELNYLQSRHHHLMKQKSINPKQLSNNRTNMNSLFRKLNMVLLGQAGLADGPKHLNELCTLLEKITNFRQKIIPPQLREEIGQHFHSIFTSTPREDYADLLSKYYVSRKTPAFSKNKKNDRFNLNLKPKQNKNINPMWQNNANARNNPISGANIASGMNSKVMKPRVENTINKLIFYRRRLLHARPIDAVLKKTRTTLVQQLHSHITSLDRHPNLSPKTLKKTRKIQEQAQLFLANIKGHRILNAIQNMRSFLSVSLSQEKLLVLFSVLNCVFSRRFLEENYYPGNVYETEQVQYAKIKTALDKLQHEPEWVKEWPDTTITLGQVSGVALDSTGLVYIFHRAANSWDASTFTVRNVYTGIGEKPIPDPTILIFNETGELIDKWGEDLFYIPHGITVDGEGNVWVTDVARHQVFKFARDQRHVPAIELGEKFVPGDDDHHFCKPSAIAVHSSGDFFVADGYCNSRIIKYTADGTKVLQWGRRHGESPFVLNIPHALALAEERGEVCAADRERGRVACFRADNGSYTAGFSSWLLGPRLFSVAYAPVHGGRLYVVNGQAGGTLVRGYVIDFTTGRLIQTFAPGDSFATPHDIAVSPDGSTVYVAELNPQRVYKFVDETLRSENALVKPNATVHTKPTATVEVSSAGGGAGGVYWAGAWGGAAGGALAGAALLAAAALALRRARDRGKPQDRRPLVHH